MSSDKPGGVSLFKVLREVRDVGMDAWAKTALTITSSAPYSLATSVLAKPGLVAAAVARRKTATAMSSILSNVNMPSRADVLALSVRLTHIETALDDLAAAVEEMRASTARRPAKRASGNHRAPRSLATPGR